ncbi:hypothetical protein [Neobacillus sp. OS1-33]|uniref:hypothetical protein n=1 Tax=Neobacillus sp. OS1-33 TaxID=3070683 RepID=UPI0027E124A3|nr:hypothetical protein [Neobacillus sp. OS1-33]WML27359.1 hypothetical protein RCG22_07005 [Neobacillus sp. OS1-33]
MPLLGLTLRRPKDKDEEEEFLHDEVYGTYGIGWSRKTKMKNSNKSLALVS